MSVVNKVKMIVSHLLLLQWYFTPANPVVVVVKIQFLKLCWSSKVHFQLIKISESLDY